MREYSRQRHSDSGGDETGSRCDRPRHPQKYQKASQTRRTNGEAGIQNDAVEKKRKRLPQREMLPAQIDGVAVDVREATGLQRLRHGDPDAYSLAAAHMRLEYREPEWPDERSIRTGEKVSKGEAASKLHAAVASGASKPQISYTPPDGAPLDPVTVTTTITACASPDDGYGVLADFLAGVKSKLTIAMYDFTSADILNEVKAAIGSSLPFQMVFDHPPLDDTANQTDEQTRTALLPADGEAQINWALTQSDPVATEWITQARRFGFRVGISM